mmetsp:Transcript_46178/g.108122  ORF Transcript_46178/g.108122 Transcript_46178/m.108122 type:complete len:326 (+) Transcript_46178:62-1039(+)
MASELGQWEPGRSGERCVSHEAAKSWTPPARLRNLLGDICSPGRSAKQAATSSSEVRSPLRSATASTSPGSTDVRLLSTPRTISSWNCTSIATPDTTSRRRATLSPSPEVQADSELELSLELVNYVQPDVADRLMARLRGAETARQLAEERCRRAQEASKVSLLSRTCTALGSLLVAAALAFMMAAEAYAMYHVEPEVPAPGTSDAETASLEKGVVWAFRDDGEGQLVEEPNLTCEAFLHEARSETQALQRRHDQLQAAFGGALQAASQWVGFLRRAIVNASGADPALCREAARPGQEALEALLADDWPVGQTEPLGTDFRELQG